MFREFLKEALDEKLFKTTEELLKTVKSVLRKSPVSAAKEKKSKTNPGTRIPLSFGYKLIYNSKEEKIKIIFSGSDISHNLHSVMSLLKDQEIRFSYSDNMIVINIDENVDANSLLLPESTEEIEDGRYNVLGSSVQYKSDIKHEINDFSSVQRKIYFDLLAHKKADWKLITTKLGKIDRQEYVFQLNPVESGETVEEPIDPEKEFADEI
jgi:hypothetical protein